jgi:hypothetical protein
VAPAPPPPIDDPSRNRTIPPALPGVLAGIEPAMVSVKFTMAYTSESLFTVKNKLRLGIYEAVKSGRRTLIRFDSIKRHMASLPAATYAPPPRRRGSRPAADADTAADLALRKASAPDTVSTVIEGRESEQPAGRLNSKLITPSKRGSTPPLPSQRPRQPAAMVVYDGQTAIGEIEDHGPRKIFAFDITPTGRVALGQFPDRRAAIRAVSDLHPAALRKPGRGAT